MKYSKHSKVIKLERCYLCKKAIIEDEDIVDIIDGKKVHRSCKKEIQ